MDRRDFLKSSALLTAGLAGSNLLPGTAIADPERRKKGTHYPELKKIDSYTHFSDTRILDALEDAVHNPKDPKLPANKKFRHVYRDLFLGAPTIINAEERIKLMDKCGIAMSIITPQPLIETIPGPYITKEVNLNVAQVINNSLAELCRKHPTRFKAVAALPTVDRDQMIGEFRRAVKELGMVGGMYGCGYPWKRPDHEDYFSLEDSRNDNLYAEAERLGVPLWLHPDTPVTKADYMDEENPPFPAPAKPVSRYQIFQAFTWLHDSTVAMVRIVFAGVFKKHPNLKIVIHHHGALVPLYAQRMEIGQDFFEQNMKMRYSNVISRPYVDHFKNFYIDTATQGYVPEILNECIKFFGVDHTLFGTDAPMDKEAGYIFTRTAINSVDDIGFSKKDLEKIYSKNAERICGFKI